MTKLRDRATDPAALRTAQRAPSLLPLDQADGLRRLFAGRGCHVLALAANPHVAFGGLVLDRVAAVLAARGREVLVVDAADTSPAAHELARLDLAACIERVAARVAYLPARGLPLAHVDTRGSSAAFIDALQAAAPDAEVLLLHADAADLARLLKRRTVRPLLLGADHPESIKHAYASCKLLVQRCELMSYDLLLAASSLSPRAADIAASLGHCADGFLGAALRDWALIDPAGDPAEDPDEALSRLLDAQLDLDETPAPQWGALAGARAAGAEPNLHRPAFR
jgi:flagellar biosynthesis protein FlhG